MNKIITGDLHGQPSSSLLDFIEEGNTADQDEFGGIPKHPSQYRTKDMDALVHELVAKFKKPDQIINSGKVSVLVRDSHICRIDQVGGFWTSVVYRMNKKKLHALIKRLMARNKVKASMVQPEPVSPWNTDHAKWDDSLGDFVMDNDQIVKEERDIEIHIERA